MHLHTVALSVSHHSCLSSPVTEVNLNMSFTLSFMFTSRRRLEKRKFSNLPYNTLEDKKVNIVSTIGCDRATNQQINVSLSVNDSVLLNCGTFKYQ